MKFLVNFQRYSNNFEVTINNNAFFLIQGMFSDSLRRARIGKDLALEGYYAESASNIRLIFEHCFYMKYLVKHPNQWRSWIKHRKYRESLATDKDLDKPKTPFNQSLENLVRELNDGPFYDLYRKLSQFSHNTGESLRSNIDVSSKGDPEFHHYPKFDEKEAFSRFYAIFRLIDKSVWESQKEMMYFIEVPEVLEEYRQMRDQASKDFSKKKNLYDSTDKEFQ